MLKETELKVEIIEDCTPQVTVHLTLDYNQSVKAINSHQFVEYRTQLVKLLLENHGD